MMIQQDFDFEPDFITPPESGEVRDTGHDFYQVELQDQISKIDLKINGHQTQGVTKNDVQAFLNGLKARTEYGNLNPVSKHLANFAYWLQYKYMKLKSWYNDD